MSDHDISLDEKRVYADRTGTETLLLATGAGLAGVSVSADKVGEFGLRTRTAARDVAVFDDSFAVADAEDVRVGPPDDLEATGFGPAVAIAGRADALLAVGPEGRVAVRGSDGEWTDRGTVPDVRRADGRLLAAADGVHRVTADGVEYAGLDDARDVAAGPRAATASGVHRLGNGWLDEQAGDATAVAARGDHAAAVLDGELREYDGDEWTDREVPLTDVAAVAYGAGALYAVASAGTVAVDAGDGWRTRAIGLPDVSAAGVLDGER